GKVDRLAQAELARARANAVGHGVDDQGRPLSLERADVDSAGPRLAALIGRGGAGGGAATDRRATGGRGHGRRGAPGVRERGEREGGGCTRTRCAPASTGPARRPRLSAATTVLVGLVDRPPTDSPPPVPAVLAVMVALRSFAVPLAEAMPPPLPAVAVLPVT